MWTAFNVPSAFGNTKATNHHQRILYVVATVLELRRLQFLSTEMRNNLTFSMTMDEAKYFYRARGRSTLTLAKKILHLDTIVQVHMNNVRILQDAEWKPVIVRIEILLMIPVPHTLMSHRCQKNKCQALVTQ